MYCSCLNTKVTSFLCNKGLLNLGVRTNMITLNTGDMGKCCLTPHPVYFNAFSVATGTVLGRVQY